MVQKQQNIGCLIERQQGRLLSTKSFFLYFLSLQLSQLSLIIDFCSLVDISHFQKLTEESSNEFDFRWNSEPKDIVCAFPYVLAFTPDSIEIRLIINGSLVHTMTMPDLTLITSKVCIHSFL